ncbi:hypothetical protein PHMEG_00020343 [Phytophthora megakarya]|uniref:Uncharacterized protein n=1 Tax=Phytophthora megakarya TaxID=4795 RepID=A0A225VPK7_9STRA|nr:hypothetical protein PHMEG_00020343 [Phytophthora megakarya]
MEALENWAAATTEVWTKEVQIEVRRQKRIETSMRFRARKKQELVQLRSERDHLELEARRRLRGQGRKLVINDDMVHAVCRLTLESNALRSDNFRLVRELQTYERFRSLSREVTESFSCSMSQSASQSVREASRVSQLVASNEPGWRVHFPCGEPSFYFHPFTRAEFDSKFRICDEISATSLPWSSIAGNLFGWTVRHAPLVYRPESNSFFAHARFTTRVNWSLDDADKVMTSSPMEAIAVLFIHPDGSRYQRDLVNMQVLQDFDQNGFVMVCNIPKDGHTRYFQLPRRFPMTESNGKRSIAYQMVIADTAANARNQSAEGYQPDVQWIHEGGTCLKFTEVDESTIDVSSDYWASCECKQHAQHYFMLWAEYAVQWTQFVAPLNFLGSKFADVQ